MGHILFLCHRIPYPPNKGDKIRSYHWLKALSANHRVHLATFIDDPQDWAYQDTVAGLCESVCIRPLRSLRARVKSLTALARGEPLTLSYYRDTTMQRWVVDTLERQPIDAIFVFSSGMGPYVASARDIRSVIDFVDVDSDKWRQYAAKSGPIMRWIYAREAERLADAEQAMAKRFDESIFVSQAEADFFVDTAPESAARVHAVGNGVDTDYFEYSASYPDPYDGHGPDQIVFTGAMDYGANVDAVCWFVESVLPQVRASRPEAQFTIVGTRPSARVLALADQHGVTVTGAVPDVRPYLAHARVAVAPMQIARGIQNKVLEALAMGRHVVMSPDAAAGLEPLPSGCVDISAQAHEIAAKIVERLELDATAANSESVAYVRKYYAWPARYEQLENLILPSRSNSRNATPRQVAS